MNDVSLITNGRDVGFFFFNCVLLLQLRMTVNTHLDGYFHLLNAFLLFLFVDAT